MEPASLPTAVELAQGVLMELAALAIFPLLPSSNGTWLPRHGDPMDPDDAGVGSSEDTPSHEGGGDSVTGVAIECTRWLPIVLFNCEEFMRCAIAAPGAVLGNADQCCKPLEM